MILTIYIYILILIFLGKRKQEQEPIDSFFSQKKLRVIV